VVQHVAQRCDHFNSQNADTFEQRYLVNASWWGGPGAPILLYTGAEGPGIPSVFDHSGYVLELARELSALAVFAEMRFFGTSTPYGEEGSFELSAERIGLLSIEQTLADNAHLIAKLRSERGAESSKVIALGGSLAGTLAFFLRAKYPHLCHAALAASAPILGYAGLTDPYGWYRVATSTFDKQAPGCVEQVRGAFAQLLAASPALISKAYNTCTPALETTAQTIGLRMTDMLSAMATSAYPRSLSPVVGACRQLAMAPGVGAFAPFITPPGTCLNVSALHAMAAHPHALLPRPPSAHRRLAREVGIDDVGGAQTADRAWYYLACTEIVHPIAANNVSDMFPPFSWDVDALASACRKLFHVSPRLEWLPESMGMAGGPKGLRRVTSRVIFSNGMLDPWSAESVTADVSETLVAINLADGSHHSDLGSWGNPWPDERSDSAALVRARREELRLLRTWLALD
jgi:lysosomal Pro-X carboxypeptidase